MYRMTILYGTPADPAAFDRYYREVHVPLAAAMQGLTSWTLSWPDDEDSRYHLVAELVAPSRAAMDAALASPEGRAAREDLDNFVTGSVEFLGGDVVEVQFR